MESMTNLLIVMMAVWLMTGCFESAVKPDWIPNYMEIHNNWKVLHEDQYLGMPEKVEPFQGSVCPGNCMKEYYANGSQIITMNDELIMLTIFPPEGETISARDLMWTIDFAGVTELNKPTASRFVESGNPTNKLYVFHNEDGTMRYMLLEHYDHY